MNPTTIVRVEALARRIRCAGEMPGGRVRRAWRRVGRVGTAAAALSVMVLATVALAVPASADGKTPVPSTPQPAGAVPTGFRTWAEVYGFQDKLNAAARRILAAGGAGNASIVAAPQNHELRVYWKGEVPPSTRALAQQLGVPVVFRPARFTHSELVKQARQLTTDARVVEVEPQADGSGLAVTVADHLLPADRSRLQSVSAVPLTITAGPKPQALFNRQADTPAFWGGSDYQTADLDDCSNGFPLKISGSPDVYMITAGHCGENGDQINMTGQVFPAGVFERKIACRDTAIIRYDSGVSGRIYTGPFDSATSAGVAGAVPDFVGNLVNTGGASSGEHLNIPVRAVDVFSGAVGNTSCATVGPLIRAGYDTPACAAASGDSGGPVYSYQPDGTVAARGTIVAGMGGTATSCPGTGTGRVFANNVFYAPLVRPPGDDQAGALAVYGVNVLICPGCSPLSATVPNVVGQNVNRATDLLSGAGLTVSDIVGTPDFTCNFIGLVADQSPDAGATVEPGSGVRLALGEMPPPPFECP
jgi:PASTA domain